MTSDLTRTTTVLLLLAVAILGFFRLGEKSYWASHAESRRAEIARNMIDTGDFMVPEVNGNVILTKPPLYYWSLAASFAVNGEATEGTARIVSALFGFATILLVIVIGAYLYNFETGLYSAGVLATSYLFVFFMRFVELDMTFTFFITLSFYFLIRHMNEYEKNVWGYLFWLATALAFMVKGPFALLFPLVAILVLVPFNFGVYRVNRIFPPLGVAGFLVITAPWFVYVFLFSEAGPIFMEEALQRAVDSRGQSRGIFYYLGSLGNFAPWILILPLALIGAFKRESAASDIVLSWFTAGFILASLIGAKNHHYILPLYPAMALLCGRYLHEMSGSVDTLSRRVTGRIGIAITFLVLLIFCAVPIAPHFTNEVPAVYPALTAMLILVTLVLSLFTLVCFKRNMWEGLWISVIATLFILFIFLHSFVLPELNTRNSHKDFIVKAGELIPLDSGVFMYRIENFQVSYYLSRTAPVIWNESDLDNIHSEYYVITESRFLSELVLKTDGLVVLNDTDFVPSSAGKEDERFTLVKVEKD